MEVDKEDEEDMPATARDLGLGFKWLHWETKLRWSEECSPWHMSPRCFLNSCSSLVACLGTKEAVKHQKNAPTVSGSTNGVFRTLYLQF